MTVRPLFVSICLALSPLLPSVQETFGEPNVLITGQYTCSIYHRQSLSYAETTPKVNFTAIISGNAWRIAATNAADRSDWEQLVFDGNSIYFSAPYKGRFAIGRTNEDSLIYTSISPAEYYLADVSDNLRIYVPWLTYGLSSNNIIGNNTMLESIPVPWYLPRLQLTAYGYQWIANFSADGKFLSTCEVRRDISLDLSDSDELLRPTFDYPHTLDDRVKAMELLTYRKSIPNHFTDARYTCIRSYNTNEFSVPVESELKLYNHSMKLADAYAIFKLKATSCALEETSRAILPPISGQTYIHDYRYKKGSGERIFAFAEYTLNAGESWKSGSDPELMAQMQNYLKHGPKYDDFGLGYYMVGIPTIIKSTIALSLLCLIQIPLIIFLLRTYRNKQTKGQTHEK